MPSFLHPALFWTLGLPTLGVVAIPVLIHLINMMRHRRIEWAAMEFLLVSQKKNRTWVMFKQWLLLLLRMAAVAAIVFLVAQPVLQNRWGNLLGDTRTHHIVLLDDSFSMSDRWEDTDAFSEAKNVLRRIGTEAARQPQPQLFTLLRFSRVGRAGRAAEPDLLKQSVGPNFVDKLGELLQKASATQMASGPIPSLQSVSSLLGQSDGEHRVVYLLSDFRARQWDEPAELRKELSRLDEAGAEVHLIDCVDRARPNLAIVSLEPADGIRAAGVPWPMEVAVKNFGAAPARDVSVILGEDGHGRPSVVLAEIPPGKTAKERFLVHFPTAGPHEISARLESDAVEADNHRYCTIDLPADVPVLLIDGDTNARDALYLSWALAPGGSVKTGIRPQIETPRYLLPLPSGREAEGEGSGSGQLPVASGQILSSSNPQPLIPNPTTKSPHPSPRSKGEGTISKLAGFAAVNVMNVDRLDATAVEALEQYVADGGGAAFFLGDRTDAGFFNEKLYRDGRGIFPVPLARQAELMVDRLEPAPDVQVEGHFIFRLFEGKRNTFLQTLTVGRYFAVPPDWRPASDSTVRVAARLRNGAPLVVERNFGHGRVLAFMTTVAPTWNNWAKNPSFVVLMQDLQAYLSRRSSDSQIHLVGMPLEVILDQASYQPQVRFITPQEMAGGVVDVNAGQNKRPSSFGKGAEGKGGESGQRPAADGQTPSSSNPQFPISNPTTDSPHPNHLPQGEGTVLENALDDEGVWSASLTDTDRSGLYEAQLTRTDGVVETRRYALNVDPAEGDLAALDSRQLAARLEGVNYKFEQAAAFQSSAGDPNGYNLSEALLIGLVLLLIVEQVVAWSAGYHPTRRRQRAQGGVA